jgi:Tol biopolymer transport system component
MKISKKFMIISSFLIALSMVGCLSSQRNGTNEEIVFQSDRDGNYDLYIMNADGSDQRILTNNPPSVTSPNNNTSPEPSPDDRRIAFESNRDGNNEIYVIDIESGIQINLTKNEANDYSPTWSPDGKYIAFVSDREAILLDANRGLWTNNIYVMEADGSNPRRLTNDNTTNTYGGLSWSPDGQKLALSLSSLTQYGGFFPKGIYLMDLGNLNLTRLTYDTSTIQGNPKWSPDGTRIMYLVLGDKLSNIFVMNADGTDQEALSNDPSIYDTSPSWSPDGIHIVFSSRRDGGFHLYVMNADGTNQIRLTDGPGEETFPVWLPVP